MNKSLFEKITPKTSFLFLTIIKLTFEKETFCEFKNLVSSNPGGQSRMTEK